MIMRGFTAQSPIAIACVLGAWLGASAGASAEVCYTPYWQADKEAWFNAAQDYKTVDFVGLSPGTYVTTQYLDLGIEFAPILNPYVAEGGGTNFGLYPEDGYGLDGNGDIEVVFSTPMHAIAASGPSATWRYVFYSGDQYICETSLWPSFLGRFWGVTTPFTFDRVIMQPPGNGFLALDNVYFSTVPGPGPLAVLAAGAILGSRRPRRRGNS